MKVLTLKKRKDFLRAAKGVKSVMPNLILQAALSLSSANKPVLNNSCYLGYTVTKKIGKAHLRNLTKRRLRAAASLVFPNTAFSGVDYVLVGRFSTAKVAFEKLKTDMYRALKEVNTALQKHERVENEVFNDKND